VYLRHRWKNPLVKFGMLQVGKVLSNGKTNMPEKNNYWKGLLESLEHMVQSFSIPSECDYYFYNKGKV